jgi:hypothetical protein
VAEDNSQRLDKQEEVLERQEKALERHTEVLEEEGKALEELVRTLEELMEARKEERMSRLEQATNFFFEIAKHLTTLNTAAILVYLAAAGSGEVSLPLWVTLLFVGSLAGATLSMLVTGLRGINTTNPYTLGNFGIAVAVGCFFVGLLYSQRCP